MNREYNTREKILNAAKEEFLEKGFKDASLRNIAKMAEVTTGAIYGYFKDKDDMFVSLLKEFLDGIYKLIEETESHDRYSLVYTDMDFDQIAEASTQSHKVYLDYLYDNIDCAKLILLRADGSSLENWLEKIMKGIIDENWAVFKEFDKFKGVDMFTVELFVEFYFNSITKFIKHDIPYSQALNQMEYINKFFFGGIGKLV